MASTRSATKDLDKGIIPVLSPGDDEIMLDFVIGIQYPAMEHYSLCYTVFSKGHNVAEHLKFAKPPFQMEPVKPDQQSRSRKTAIKDEVEMNTCMAEMEKYVGYLDPKRQFQTEDNKIVKR